MRAFVKSVMIGAFAPAIPFLFLSTFIAFGMFNHDGRLLDALWIALLPMVVTLPIVTLSALLIGLPFTALLRRYRRESQPAYLIGGAIAGLMLPTIAFAFAAGDDGYLLGLLGAFSGAVTAGTWWRTAREPVVLADLAND